MMMPANRYKAVAQNTASRERLLVLLLQRAHACMEQAVVLLDEKSGEKNGKKADEAIDKALAIVTELTDTLDPAKGAAVCTALGDIYAFVTWKLIAGQRSRASAEVAAAARSFRPIVEAFESAVSQMGAGHAG